MAKKKERFTVDIVTTHYLAYQEGNPLLDCLNAETNKNKRLVQCIVMDGYIRVIWENNNVS